MNGAPLLACALLLAGCEREQRDFDPLPPTAEPAQAAPRSSALQPATHQGSGTALAPRHESPYEENAYNVAQGKRLFRWFNCNGCHGAGGGGMGPPLMDSQWRYGSEPAQVFESIMRGRPNGMPSFAGHVPEDQVWQLVAYVRSMSGQLRKDVAPSRGDTLSPGPPENARPPLEPVPETPPEAPR